ncbi:2-amino-4-hydroxy-6-hydroxymethyldihydropteridine diphosphokinase [Agaribacter marinus]|uniref:2-amino-4-hydroxy-6-hydroxymethyldihydropteridine pyrophosphokinase n=1 Tax=Agaribacter marinus TaxID=1431249 RepID=A0AA37SZ44_9ALTE|nr:2-amino-4-hydroxy-6-hydroxymethyldihydropteridine diphosphokinase [Agaribacter marinus]GLR72358.1 2-amino-4-hydroxy-6-hydroxymethyldihydropteridine diphosphokinase [Agaribacter marinus]
MLTDIAYIGMGSNLEEPSKQLLDALANIHKLPQICVQTCSHLYQSLPMGSDGQPDYINAVCKITTSFSPIELLDALQSIENMHGRVRNSDRWGPRTLDLDILLFNRLNIDEPRLKVPHYGMQDREFVLVPLFEIEPDLIMHDGKNISSWVSKCQLDGLRRIDMDIDVSNLIA